MSWLDVADAFEFSMRSVNTIFFFGIFVLSLYHAGMRSHESPRPEGFYAAVGFAFSSSTICARSLLDLMLRAELLTLHQVDLIVVFLVFWSFIGGLFYMRMLTLFLSEKTWKDVILLLLAVVYVVFTLKVCLT